MPEETTKAYMTGKDLPLLPDGSTYHLGAKKGDIYPRIITVGSPSRAEAMSRCLTVVEKTLVSSRQFHIYTGKYKGVGVSIIAIGMGSPMMDFMIREASYICDEPMAIIRVGTCGIFNRDVHPGTVITAGKGCATTYVNYASWTGGCWNDSTCNLPQYLISKPIKGTDELNNALLKCLTDRGIKTHNGLNVAADFFYSSQGRKGDHFDDGDNQMIHTILQENKVDSCEMESFTLFFLGRQRRVAPLYTAACHIGLLNRVNPDITENIHTDTLHKLEVETAYAALEALIGFDLSLKRQ